MKKQYKIILEIFIVIMIIIALGYCNKCVHKSIPHVQDASIKEAKLVYNQKLKEVEIIEKIRIVQKHHYNTVYDTIYKTAPDTCHYYLAKLNAECKINDSINDLVIKAYGAVIDAGMVYQLKKDSLIFEQDLVIDSLKKSRKKYFKGFRHGFFAGAIIVQSLNLGAKLIK